MFLGLSFDAFDHHIKNKSQIARIITEQWVVENIFCPSCGDFIKKHSNNRPVADFYCQKCLCDFELKSKNGVYKNRVNSGSYEKMNERLSCFNSPHFFFMEHNGVNVKNFFLIPGFFFTPQVIEKRKPLSKNAKRAGWVGCNILFNQIPQESKIFYVRDSIVAYRESVLKHFYSIYFMRNQPQQRKKWLFEIILCIEKVNKEIFTLKDLYFFEDELKIKFRNNHHIKDKIRQQLQFLRDQNFLEFLGNGVYRRTILQGV